MGSARLDEGLVLDMAKDRIDTSLEDSMDRQMKAAGITGYERNKVFIPGRRYRADFWFKDLKLVIEVDGGLWKRGGHTTGVGAHRDRERDILAYTRGGILTFRVGTDHVKKSDSAIDWIKDIVARRKAELGVS